MLPASLVIGVSFAYLALLFAVAYWGDRRAAAGRSLTTPRPEERGLRKLHQGRFLLQDALARAQQCSLQRSLRGLGPLRNRCCVFR